MKKIYLDVCTLCRPFDNQSLMRIRLEDDKLLKKIRQLKDNHLEAINPVNFCIKEDLR